MLKRAVLLLLCSAMIKLVFRAIEITQTKRRQVITLFTVNQKPVTVR